MKWIYRHPHLYDLLDTLVSFSFSGRVRRKVLGGIEAGTLLEIGIGSGKCLEYVGADLAIGLDGSHQMLMAARKRFPEARLEEADAHSLPFRDGSFEVSLFSFCLAAVSRPADAIKEALRVSRKVLVLDYGRPRCVPRLLWERTAMAFGRKVFGSGRPCFETAATAARVSRTYEFYNRLYRLVVLDGVSDG